jgi:hypothetical protein
VPSRPVAANQNSDAAVAGSLASGVAAGFRELILGIGGAVVEDAKKEREDARTRKNIEEAIRDSKRKRWFE